MRATIAIEVQILFFKWSGTLADYNRPQYYDSWRDRDCKNKFFEYNNVEGKRADYFRLADGSYCYEAPADQLASSSKSMWEIMFTEAVPVTQDLLGTTKEGRFALLESGEVLLYDYDSGTLIKPTGDEDFVEYTRYEIDKRFSYSSAEDYGFTPMPMPVKAEAMPEELLVDEKHGGIWPISDYKILQDVYSDLRAKIVIIEELGAKRPYLFRIATVDVMGVMRPQLVCHKIVDGNVLNAEAVYFDTGIPGVERTSLCDYDFDIIY